MENLPDEVVKRIIRESAEDEDSMVIDEGPGEVSSDWHRLTQEMKQSWSLYIHKDMVPFGPMHESGFAHYEEFSATFRLMKENRSQPETLDIVLEGDTLPLPLIPAEFRAHLRKIRVRNKGSISRMGFMNQRADVPLPLGFFDGSLFPALKKLIAPSHALPQATGSLRPNAIKTLECYYLGLGISEEGRVFRSLELCPSLVQLRVHGSRFSPLGLRLPVHITHFWFKADMQPIFGYSIAPEVPMQTITTLLQENPQLVELLLDSLEILSSFPFSLVHPAIRRVALLHCTFPDKKSYELFRQMFPKTMEQWREKDISFDDNPRPRKRPRYEGKIWSLIGLGLSLDQFVPQDGRTEYERGTYPFVLPVNTTLFHARVNPSPLQGSNAHDVYSRFYGLTLSHPCTVLIQHLLIDPKKPTGHAHIYEYETIAPIPMKNFGYGRFDELVLPNLNTSNLKQFLRVKRSYFITTAIIQQSPILAFQHGNDGAPNPTSVAGRWAEPADRAELVRVGPPHFDSDYLHMTQFWYKMMPAMGMRMDQAFMTLQAILCGADRTGQDTLELHAYYVYDTGKRFTFLPPIIYRDEDSIHPRKDMPYCVGLLVVYTGTKDYDLSGGFTLTEERKRFAPVDHQGEIIGLVSEQGYEERVWALADGVLAGLNWDRTDPILHHMKEDGLAQLPLFQARCKELDIVL